MRLIIQRVQEAKVEVEGKPVGEITQGLLVLLGIEDQDADDDIDWLCRKLINMRIFPDQDSIMNLSSLDVEAEILVVSQFTLHASTKKGNRPSFIKSASSEKAKLIYRKFIDQLKQSCSLKIEEGQFGAMMQVSLINDGSVTIFIDSKDKE